MTDKELIAYLRLQGLDKDVAAADRIEELVKQRDDAEHSILDIVASLQAEARVKLFEAIETPALRWLNWRGKND